MMDLEILIKEYLSYLIRINRAKRTIEAYEPILKNFKNYLEQQHLSEVIEIREQHILDYQKYRSHYINRYKKQDNPVRQNLYLGAVKKFLEYLRREGYIITNPAQSVEYVRVPKRLPKPALTYKEFLKFVSKIDIQNPIGYRNRTIIEVFYSSAVRRNELLNLKLKDTDYIEGYLRILGKGDRERVVPVGKTACQYLENYIKGIRPLFCYSKKSDYLFVSKCNIKLSQHGLKEMIKKYALAAKIEMNVTPHTFRRSAATGMIRNKANIMLVKDMLGHDSMDAINRYIDLTINDLKEAHKKTHPRESRKRQSM